MTPAGGSQQTVRDWLSRDQRWWRRWRHQFHRRAHDDEFLLSAIQGSIPPVQNLLIAPTGAFSLTVSQGSVGQTWLYASR